MAAAALLASTTIPVVRLLFQRAAFDAADTLGSAEALFFYAFAVPVWTALQVLSRAFYARRDMWTPVVIGTVVTIAAVPLYFALQRGYGLRGVAVASTLALTAYTAALGIRWYRSVEPGRVGAMLEPALRAVPLSLFGGVAAAAAATAVESLLSDGFAATLAAVVAAAVAFGAVFLAAGRLLAPVARGGAVTGPSRDV